jgi:hydroxymethylpyrimidine/phosphomethylpyrimidine kinase
MDLNQITVPCTDYDVSVEFYKKLGLRQIVHSPPRYARFETDAGTTFSLHNGRTDTSNVVIYFEVEDVDTEVERLKADGIEFESAPMDQEWLWREAYLRDPAGNRICIYHGGENRRFPAWRI